MTDEQREELEMLKISIRNSADITPHCYDRLTYLEGLK